MEKVKINYVVDVVMGIAFVLCAVTGVVKLPAVAVHLGSLPWRELSTLHDASGVLLAITALVHLLLHFDWLMAMTKSLFEKKK